MNNINFENNKKIKRIVIIGLTAAVYIVMTLAVPFPAYGMVQFRISEVINLLVFFNPVFAPGIVLGCFISNIFSSLNPVLDCILGTMATICTVFCIAKSKNLFIASLFPTLFCFFVGIQIVIAEGEPYTLLNFAVFTGFVMLGEFAVMTLVGYPLFRRLEKTNPGLIEFLRNI